MHASLDSLGNTTSGRIRTDRPNFSSLPPVKLHANCGCGFRASEGDQLPSHQAVIEEARLHSASTGHTVHITGEIRSRVY